MYGHLNKKTGKIIALFMVICAMTLSMMTGCVKRKSPVRTTGTTASVTETTASVTTKASETTKETSEETASSSAEKTEKKAQIDENGTYDSAKDVSAYVIASYFKYALDNSDEKAREDLKEKYGTMREFRNALSAWNKQNNP